MSNTPRDPLRRKGRRCMSLTRRTVLGGIAATGATFVASAPFIGKARAATPDLRLLMWQPYMIKETVQGFEEKYKARFSPTFFDGNSEAFNKMKVGGTKDFDIVMGDGFWPRLYFRQGLTQPIDYGKIPNMSGVFPEFLPGYEASGWYGIAAPTSPAPTRSPRRTAGAATASPSTKRKSPPRISARSPCSSTRNTRATSRPIRGSRRTSP